MEIRLILDNIRSVHNVGSIFRTADAAGVVKIYCVETTPTPIDRFGRSRRDLAKVSLGAEKSVAWEHVANVRDLILDLRRDGLTIVALEQDDRSVDYRKILQNNKKGRKSGTKSGLAIILGNEVSGVSKELLDIADIIAEIPMKGSKESLNVSVAAGIVLFSLSL